MDYLWYEEHGLINGCERSEENKNDVANTTTSATSFKPQNPKIFYAIKYITPTFI